MLSNEHLIELSKNAYFDTVEIDMPYKNWIYLADGLAVLKTFLLPRKVTISSGSSQTLRWTQTFETIAGERIFTETYDTSQLEVSKGSSHSCGTRIRGKFVNGDPVDIYEPACGRDICCANQKDIFSVLQMCAKIEPIKIDSFWEEETNPSSMRNLILSAICEKNEDHFSLIPNLILKPERYNNISAILATLPTLALESSSTELSYTSVGEIYVEPTKKFSVFSLKK